MDEESIDVRESLELSRERTVATGNATGELLRDDSRLCPDKATDKANLVERFAVPTAVPRC